MHQIVVLSLSTLFLGCASSVARFPPTPVNTPPGPSAEVHARTDANTFASPPEHASPHGVPADVLEPTNSLASSAGVGPPAAPIPPFGCRISDPGNADAP